MVKGKGDAKTLLLKYLSIIISNACYVIEFLAKYEMHKTPSNQSFVIIYVMIKISINS